MAARAKAASAYSILKLKLGGGVEDETRMRAVRQAAPEAQLIVDANEAWSLPDLPRLFATAAETGIELIEQPLPAGADAALSDFAHKVPICADESAHDSRSLEALIGRYEAVNIKLDKTGGLTEALATAERARTLGFQIMVGCMVATSLSMAPALLLAQGADYVDLDGPLLLARDREPGLVYEAGLISPPSPALWG
jgi:L-Ala-D/L-Glu epimerase